MNHKLNKEIGSNLYLLAILVDTEEKLQKLLKFLSANQIATIQPNDLAFLSYLPENRVHSIFRLLVDLKVIVPGNNKYSGSTDKSRLLWLEEHLSMFIGVLQHTSSQSPKADAFELAWTLPEQINIVSDEIPFERSLAGLIKSVISRARHNLYILSPFLDITGLDIIEVPLQSIAARKVTMTLISHGLDANTEFTKGIIRRYREIVPEIRILTTPLPRAQNPYLLAHAKLIISDQTYAVLSSANLTGYGLNSHLEIGVGLSGPPVKTLYSLISALVDSPLVNEV